MRIATLSVAAIVLLTVGAQDVAANPANPARAKPSVAFKITTKRVTSKSTFDYQWTASHVGRHARVFLQHQVGSNHVWKTYSVLAKHRGSGSDKAPAQGKWEFRVEVQTAKGKLVAVSKPATLLSFGKVSLGTWCTAANQAPYNVAASDLACGRGTVQVGSTIFTYEGEEEGPGDYPTYNAGVQSKRTTCRSLSLSWATDPNDQAYVEIVQGASSPQYGSGATNAVTSHTFSLDGGAWYLDDATSNFGYEYFNGNLSCYSRTGF